MNISTQTQINKKCNPVIKELSLHESNSQCNKNIHGRKPWSGGCGRLKFRGSWVQIPAPFTGWTFFIFICCINCDVCLKRRKPNKKRPGMAHVFLKKKQILLQVQLRRYLPQNFFVLFCQFLTERCSERNEKIKSWQSSS